MKYFCWLIVILQLGWLNSAFAQDICANAAAQGDAAVREQYQHTIDYFVKIAAAAQLRGFDPTNFPQADENGNVQAINLVAIIQRLSSQRDQAIAQIYQAFQECRSNVAPYQKIVDVASFFLFGGLQQVVPERATHIDASRLLAGTPFGGPNALIPQSRDYLMARLGIGGDAANLIRNPLQIGQQGPFRAPWVPMFAPGIPLPALPSIGSLPNLPQLPSIPSPPPIEIGSVGGHRVCIPWC
jgi:hypothetical protein